MKNIPILFGLSLLILFSATCKKKSDECVCRDLENCVDGKCVLKENCYYLNNQGFIGNNLYHGVVKGNICVDTLLFDVNPSQTTFALVANVPPQGMTIIESNAPFVTKISGNEYVMGSGTTICRRNGKEWFASYIHCKIDKDSVLMNIHFRERSDPIDRIVDSCQVTLYK